MQRWMGICSRGFPLADGVSGFFERTALYRDSVMVRSQNLSLSLSLSLSRSHTLSLARACSLSVDS